MSQQLNINLLCRVVALVAPVPGKPPGPWTWAARRSGAVHRCRGIALRVVALALMLASVVVLAIPQAAQAQQTPAAPTGLVATPGDGAVSLVWDDPDNAAVTGYELSVDGGVWTAVGGSDASTTSHTVTGLTNGTAYTFAVRAVNGAASAAVSATPVPATPAAPTGLVATPGDGAVILVWDDPDNAAVTGYELSVDGGVWTAVGGSDASTTSHTVTGLTNGTAYTFAVRAVNGAASAAVSATPVLGAPTGLVATPGDGAVILVWDDPDNAAVTGYELSVDGGVWTAVGGSDASTTSHTVTGLTNGTVYTFAVRAVNGAASAAVSATPVLGAPTGLVATPGDGAVILVWDDPDNAAITGYELSVDGGAWNAVGGSDASTTSHTVTGLTNGTAYTFAVRAVNGAASAAVSATPVLGAPTGLVATPGDGQVILVWDDPDNAAITGYELSVDDGAWTAVGGSDASTTSHTVTGLTNGTAYTFAVRAVNGAASAAVSATPVLAAPTGLMATPGDSAVILVWDDPDNAAVTGYELSVDGGVWNAVGGSDASTTSHTVTGLTNGTAYTFAVRAVNGAASAAVSATPVLAAPTGLVATPGDSAVILVWDDPDNAAITGYELSVDDGDWNAVDGSDASMTSHVVVGLVNGTVYTFWVRAVDGEPAGVSGVPVAAPTGLVATPGDGQVTLGWDDPVNATITGYEVSVDDGATWTAVEGSDASTTSHVVTGLVNGTAYTLRVRAVTNRAGPPSVRVAATLVLGPPTNLRAITGDETVELKWNTPHNAAIIGYELRVDDGDWDAVDGSDASTTSHTVTGLVNGTGYDFRVRAVNGTVNGAASVAVSVTPMAVPIGLVATPGDGQMTLVWDDPVDAAITGYELSIDGGTWNPIVGSDASTTSHTVTGLVNGTEYTFAVREVDGEAASVPGVPVAAPTGLVATPGDERVILVWDDPGVGWIVGYEVSSNNGATWTAVEGSTASTTTTTVTGLVNGTGYILRVRAVTSRGGPSSAAVRVRPQVYIPDASLRSKVRAALGTSFGAVITGAEMETLTSFSASSAGISDLTGLEYATNLRILGLRDNSVSDLGPLSGLTDLRILGLWYNSVSDLGPLSGLTDLTTLYLRDNSVSDLGPLSGLTDLRILYLESNSVSDLGPLSGLTDLRILYLESNSVSDLGPLSGLTDLTNLNLGGNSVSDLGPLSGLTDLRILGLRDNSVSDLGPLSGLTDLRILGLWYNSVSDLGPLSGLIDLTILGLGSNSVSDLGPLSGLIDLTTLYLGSNSVSDLGPLSGLTDLRILDLGGNSVSDLGPLSGLIDLTTLYLGSNSVSDLGPLSGLIDLTTLYLGSNSVSDLGPLSGLTDLTTLGLWSNSVSDLGPLVQNTGLGTGDRVDVSGNPLDGASFDTHIPVLESRGVAVYRDSVSWPAPVNLTVIPGEGEVTLVWDDPGNDGITGYRVGVDGVWTAIANSTATTMSHTVTGLVNGTVYTFRVRAVDGAASVAVSVTPLWSAPVNLRAIPRNEAVTLKWHRGDTAVSGYELRVDDGDWTVVAGSDASTTSHTVTGLVNGTEYTFAVREVDGEAASVPGVPVAAPTGLVATPGVGRVILVWDDPGVGWIVGYGLSSDDGATWTAVAGSTASTTTTTVTGLVNGTEYILRVRAVTSRGGPPSARVIVVPQVYIPDGGLRSVVEAALGKSFGAVITGAEMETLTVITASSAGISDLTGLEYATGLERLELDGNSVSDLGQLAELISLTWLDLSYNFVSDVGPLSGLVNLTRVSLGGNSVSDVGPLEGLVNLTGLDLSYNFVSDVGPLSELTNLEVLEFDGNSVSDVGPLSELDNLTFLWLRDNFVSDVGPLEGLVNLTGLDLSDNFVSDVGPLSELVNLRHLWLRDNFVSDVGPLAGLVNLRHLWLRDNFVSDVGPLVQNTGLGTGDRVDMRGNPLDGASFDTHIPVLESRGVTVFRDSVSWPAPVNLTVIPGEGEVTLVWDDPGNDGITGYRVGVDGVWTAIANSTATTTSHTVTGLVNGTGYTFRVRAVDGAASVAVGVTPLWSAPVNLRAIPRNEAVDLKWHRGDTAVSGYELRVDDGDWTVVAGSDASTTSHTVTGLVNGTEYTFAVREVDGAAASVPGVPVAAPTGLVATPGDGRVILVWDDPGVGWIVGYGLSSDDGATWTAVEGSTASTTSHTVTGLVNGTGYILRVRAVTSRGGPPSARVAVVPQVHIPDGGLRSVVEAALGKSFGAVITGAEMETLTVITASSAGISDLTGLEYATGLVSLNLRDNSVSDLGPLSGIVNLKSLWLWDNFVSDLEPLSRLVNLEYLNFDGNSVSDLGPLEGLDELMWLELGGNSVSDLEPLSELTNLEVLEFDGNSVSDVGPLSELDNLTFLWFQNNSVSDVEPLEGLDNLKGLYLRNNSVSNLGPLTRNTGLSSGDRVDVRGNPLGGASIDTHIPALESRGVTVDRDSVSWPAPVNLTATPGAGSVTLEWDDPGNDEITGYRVGVDGVWTAIANSTATTTSHTVTGLVNGTGYDFRVRAVNGAASAAVTAEPVPWPAPTDLRAIPRDGAVILKWDRGDTAVSGYELRVDDGDWTVVAGSDASTTGHTVTGLVNGTEYDFGVRAVDGEAASVPGVPVAAPTGLVATPGVGRVTLEWDDPGTGWIVGYELSSDDGATWTAVEGSTATTTAHVVTDLVSGTGYVFRVRAVTNRGGPPSARVRATPLWSAPVDLRAIPRDGAVILKWDRGDTAVSGYELRVDDGDWTVVAGSDASTTGHAVTGLVNGTEYDFGVRAVDGEAASVPGVPVAAPTGLVATPGVGQVTLEWDDPGTGWIVGYELSSDDGVTWTAVEGSTASTTAHVVTDLVSGTEYDFRVRAVTNRGGPQSDRVRATPLWSAPTNLRAIPRDGAVILKWDRGDTAVSGYELRVDDGDWTVVAGSDASTTGHTVTGLVNGTEYTFAVRAVDGEAASVPGVPVAAPTGLVATPGVGQVTLEWDDPGTGWIVGYELSSNDGATWTAVEGSTASTTAHVVTDLVSDTGYIFRVRAVTNRGGPPSARVRATPLWSAPTNLRAIPDDGAVILKWHRGDTAVSGYELRVDDGDWTVVAGSDASTTSHTVTGLVNGTEYDFGVRAVDGEAASVPGVPVAAPTGLVATPGVGQVTLEWDDPGTGWIVGYELSSNDGATWTAVEGSTATTTSHTVTGLTGGIEYILRVRAVTNRGGPPSARVRATPLWSAPVDLRAIPRDGAVILKWDRGDTAVSGYELRVDDGDWTVVAGSDASTTSHTVTGLVNGTEYDFGVRAVNGEAASVPGVPVAAPTGLVATPGVGHVTLEWHDPGTGWIVGYELSSNDGATWTAIADSTASTTTHVVTDLFSGTEYIFRVRAVTNRGGPQSARVRATLLWSAPTNLRAIPDDGAVTLKWHRGDTAVSGYELRVDDGDWTVVAGSDASTTSHTVTGLVNGTEYDFGVRAVNGEAASVPGVPVAAPTGLVATPGVGQVTLEWDDPGTGWIVGYEVSSNDVATWTAIADSTASTTTHVVTDLVSGTGYIFRVRAVTNGAGPPSARVTATPLWSAPTNLRAIPRDGAVTLKWHRGDTAVSGYQLRVDDGSWTAIGGSDGSTTSHVVTGLVNGTVYTFAVRGVNGAAASVSGVPVAAPTGLKATPGDGEVTLEWDDPDNAAIVGYEVSVDDGATWTAVAGSDASTTGHTVTGLTGGTGYDFRVRAVTNRGGPPSARVAATPVTATPVLGPPTNLWAIPGDWQVTLVWDDPGDASVTGYQVSVDDGSWTAIGGSDASTTSTIVTGLVNGTTYTLRVRAVTNRGGPPSARVTATPLWSAPTNLRAIPGDGQVTLEWDDPGDTAVSGYELRVDDGSWTAIGGSDASTTSHVVSGLVNGTEYDFWVGAVNGEASDTVSATPVWPAPSWLWAFPSDGEVALYWDWPNVLGSGSVELSVDGGVTWGEVTASLGWWWGWSHTVTGLVNGTEYDFRVRAVNGEAASVTATPVLGPPTNLRAIPGDGQVTLEWDDPGDASVTGYQVSVDDGSWTAIGGSDVSTTSHVVSGLVNGTGYDFRVRAVNGAASDTVSATPVWPAPSWLVAAPGDGEVRLFWGWQNVLGSGSVIGFELSVDGGVTWGEVTAGWGLYGWSHTVTGLVNGTTYTFAVRAVDGEAASVTATPVLGSPTNLRAIPGDGQVTLEWDDPDNASVTGYQVSVDYGSWTAIGGSDASTTSHVVSGLVNGTGYDFRVRAVNGAASDTVSATPVWPAPTGLWAFPGDGAVVLLWGWSNGSVMELSVDGGVTWGEVTAGWSGWFGVWFHPVTGLVNGTTYTFAVRAVDGEAASVTATPG